MAEFEFIVKREMTGDRAYAEGDTRTMIAGDALHLVRLGRLEPATDEGKKAMADMIGSTPEARSGIVQQVKRDAPNNKAMGNAPHNGDAGSADANKTGRRGRPRSTPAGQDTPPAPPAPPVVPPVVNGAVSETPDPDAPPPAAPPSPPAGPTGKRR